MYVHSHAHQNLTQSITHQQTLKPIIVISELHRLTNIKLIIK